MLNSAAILLWPTSTRGALIRNQLMLHDTILQHKASLWSAPFVKVNAICCSYQSTLGFDSSLCWSLMLNRRKAQLMVVVRWLIDDWFVNRHDGLWSCYSLLHGFPLWSVWERPSHLWHLVVKVSIAVQVMMDQSWSILHSLLMWRKQILYISKSTRTTQ